MNKLLITVFVSFIAACGGVSESTQESTTGPLGDRSETAADTQWAACGVATECASGLECFGSCTFECGEKYIQAADGSFSYGLDQPSVDRCTALGGTCEAYDPTVAINICKAGKGTK